MVWYKSESTVRPDEVDTTSSKKVVYLRRNVVEKQCESENDGEMHTYFEYDEAKLTKEDYEKYLQVAEAVNMRQIRADVDYIALCCDVEL